jgi:hypothetical protein
MSAIDFRREFPSADLEIRTTRLQAILAAHHAGIGDERTPVVLLIDALNATVHLYNELFATAQRWGVLDQNNPESSCKPRTLS